MYLPRSVVSELLDLYGQTTKAVRALTDAALRQHGLVLGQDHLLARLWDEDGATPGQIAAALGVSTPAVTKGATVLERAGLLERRRDPSDKRLIRLWLTRAGQRLREPVERARQQVEEALLRDLSHHEIETLRVALAKIQRAAVDALPPTSSRPSKR
jgi:DNA-binding MarR family transcriptional regulator